jgi:hypothetical protein
VVDVVDVVDVFDVLLHSLCLLTSNFTTFFFAGTN